MMRFFFFFFVLNISLLSIHAYQVFGIKCTLIIVFVFFVGKLFVNHSGFTQHTYACLWCEVSRPSGLELTVW